MEPENGRPPPYRRVESSACPKLGPFVGIIDAILTAYQSASVKQRHMTMQIYHRLVAESGGRVR